MPVIDCKLPAVFQETLWRTHGIPTLIDWATNQTVYPWCIPDEDLLKVLRSIWDLLYAEISFSDSSNCVTLRIVGSVSLDSICAHTLG